MTPQELMDMPGYGKAEEYLRKTGKWKLTKEERIDKALGKLDDALDDARDAFLELEVQQ